jgi:hypothetical protein
LRSRRQSRSGPVNSASLSFDPADWLHRFSAAGGWYAAQGGEVLTGWRLDDFDQARAVREIWRELEHDEDRRAAVRAIVAKPVERVDG